MGEVTPLCPGGKPRRALFSDERGTGLRATWHPERGLVVLSLWREDTCVGTFRLGPAEADRLAAFLADPPPAARAFAATADVDHATASDDLAEVLSSQVR